MKVGFKVIDFEDLDSEGKSVESISVLDQSKKVKNPFINNNSHQIEKIIFQSITAPTNL